jgi:hypothetical protein
LATKSVKLSLTAADTVKLFGVAGAAELGAQATANAAKVAASTVANQGQQLTGAIKKLKPAHLKNAAEQLRKTGEVAAKPGGVSYGSVIPKQPPKVSSKAPSVVERGATAKGTGQVEVTLKNSSASQILPKTRSELYADLKSKGFIPPEKPSAGGYETWKGPNGVKINIKPTGEVIRSQKVWSADKVRKYGERQDYFGNRLPDQSHSTGHFVK